MLKGFREFIVRGNVVDLAVAVVIGAAFSTVINSLVTDIIMPSLTYVTTAAAEAGNKAAEVAKTTASAVGVTSKPAETQPAATQPADAAAAAVQAQKAADDAAQKAADKAVADKAAADKAAAADAAKKKDDTKPVEITWTIGRIKIGNFIGSLINFVLVAFAVFVVIVKLLGSVMKRMGPQTPAEGPTTKECPYCLSVIPIKAAKCSACTSDQPAIKTA